MSPRRRKNPPDGRVNNGGVRQPTPGTRYTNRSDLAAAPVTTVPGQTYGQGVAQARAQQAVPMAGAPVAPPSAVPAAPRGPMPGAGGDPMRPTERPDEPVTAGVPVGPGPGPEALPPMGDTTIDELRALYSMYPAESIREIIEDLQREQGLG